MDPVLDPARSIARRVLRASLAVGCCLTPLLAGAADTGSPTASPSPKRPPRSASRRSKDGSTDTQGFELTKTQVFVQFIVRENPTLRIIPTGRFTIALYEIPAAGKGSLPPAEPAAGPSAAAGADSAKPPSGAANKRSSRGDGSQAGSASAPSPAPSRSPATGATGSSKPPVASDRGGLAKYRTLQYHSIDGEEHTTVVIEPGTYLLEVSAPGYQTLARELTIKPTDKLIDVALDLAPRLAIPPPGKGAPTGEDR